VLQQPGAFEDLQVSRRRRPGLLEHLGNLTGRHRPAVEINRDQDLPADRVRQRREHCLVRVLPLAGFVVVHGHNLA
jgi:hypothetical protein